MVTDRPAGAAGGDRHRRRADDRAVSITVTHVLTIGITTILVAGLLIGAGNMLDTQNERSVDRSLEIVGERLAGEVSHADHLAADGADNVTITADHPRRIAGSQYTVELLDADGCDAPLIEDDDACLRLATTDDAAYVPVSAEVNNSSARGGTIVISNDGSGVEIGEP